MRARSLSLISCSLVALLVGCDARWDDDTHVGGSIEGRQLALSPRAQHRLANEALKVLETCSYHNLHPTGDYAAILTNTLSQSHLEIRYAEPRTVNIHGRLTLEVREMVVRLPLSSGAFLVRSNRETLYFAKFDCPLAQEMEKTLREALAR